MSAHQSLYVHVASDTNNKETSMTKNQRAQTIRNNADLALQHKLVRAKLAAGMVLDMLTELEQEWDGTNKRDWGFAGSAGAVYQDLLETMGRLRGCEPEDADEVVEDLLASDDGASR